MPRRNVEAAHHRDARAGRRQAGTTGAARLRIRTQWRGQSVHDVRAAGRLALRESHRPPRGRRLRPRAQGFVRHVFSRCGQDRSGSGQSQHAHDGVALRSLSRRRSASPRRTVRMALYAQARKLARHGRIRTRRPLNPVPRPTHPEQAGTDPGSRRLGTTPQQTSRQGRLAIHNRRRPRQTRQAIPSVRVTRATSYAFGAPYQRQRPALLELNGVVYVGFGSFCDFESQYSRGWILGWNASSLLPLSANQLNDTQTTADVVADGYPYPQYPPMFLTSVWMSGYGIASDGTSLYFSTGNSDCNWTVYVNPNPCPSSTTWTGTTHIQESVAQLSSGLALGGVFTPSTAPNTYTLDQRDADLGSGGVMLFSTNDATYPYLAVAAGKDGRVFLLNPANLGQPTNTTPPTSTPQPLNTQPIESCWCGPSFFIGPDGGRRIVTSHGSRLRTWRVQMSASPTLTQEATATISSGQDSGFFTSVSSNGTGAGSAIIWAVGRPTGTGANPKAVTLFAFAATPPSGSTTLTQLFSAPAESWPNTGGNANIVPVVANGKVFVASAYLDGSGNTRGQLNIFGKGGTGAPISSASIASAVAPASAHTISGTLVAISGETLTLRTRAGKTATIDASGALRNERVTGPLMVGTPYTAQGTTFDTSGALLATAIGRAKPSSGLWPSDR